MAVLGHLRWPAAIARPPQMCRRILHQTGLDQYIPVTATLDRAITHLAM